MLNITSLWRDQRSRVARSGALTMSLYALAVVVAGLLYLEARDDLYEQMGKRQKFAALSSEEVHWRL